MARRAPCSSRAARDLSEPTSRSRLLERGHQVIVYDNFSRAGVERNLRWLDADRSRTASGSSRRTCRTANAWPPPSSDCSRDLSFRRPGGRDHQPARSFRRLRHQRQGHAQPAGSGAAVRPQDSAAVHLDQQGLRRSRGSRSRARATAATPPPIPRRASRHRRKPGHRFPQSLWLLQGRGGSIRAGLRPHLWTCRPWSSA